MIELSHRVKKVEPSTTLSIAAKAKELIKQGVPILSLSAGEPDLDPPYELKEAAISAIREGNAHYTPVSGLPELKSLLIDKLKNENNIEVKANNIIITNGAKYALYEVMQAIINPDDEVLVIAPYWVSYIEQIRLAGAVPKIIETTEDDGFKLDVDDLEKHITSRVKGIVLNYPSNPSGATYNQEELRAILELAYKKDIFIISDEIYEYFSYAQSHVSIASLNKKMMERVITINGFSKAYAIPGWRVGYTVAHPDIITAMNNIQSHSTSNPNTIAQMACIAALKESKKYIQKMIEDYRERRKYFIEALNNLHGFRCFNPGGAFYAFPNIQYYLGNMVGGTVPNNSSEFSELLLTKANVAVIPGSAFGAEGFVRMSYTLSIPKLQEAVKRINSILEK